MEKTPFYLKIRIKNKPFLPITWLHLFPLDSMVKNYNHSLAYAFIALVPLSHHQNAS